MSYSAHSAIYKCDNGKGVIFYNDKPCPVGDTEKEMKAVKAPKDPYIPKEYVEGDERNVDKQLLKGSTQKQMLAGDKVKSKDADNTDNTNSLGVIGETVSNNSSEENAKNVEGSQNSSANSSKSLALTKQAKVTNDKNNSSLKIPNAHLLH